MDFSGANLISFLATNAFQNISLVRKANTLVLPTIDYLWWYFLLFLPKILSVLPSYLSSCHEIGLNVPQEELLDPLVAILLKLVSKCSCKLACAPSQQCDCQDNQLPQSRIVCSFVLFAWCFGQLCSQRYNFVYKRKLNLILPTEIVFAHQTV